MDLLEQLTKSGSGLLGLGLSAISIVALLALLLFRKEISGLLNRWQPGNGLNAAKAQSEIRGNEQPRVDVPANAPFLVDDLSLRPWESDIEADLDKLPEAERVPRLKRALAAVQRLFQFETAGRVIFGTQVFALSAMRSGDGIDESGLRQIFEEHRNRVKAVLEEGAASPEFFRWLGFLTDRSFVQLERGKYRLTTSGTQFLDYLRGQGINEAKDF